MCLQDIVSGTCTQVGINLPIDQGGLRDLTLREDTEKMSCGYQSMEGFTLSERLECDVRHQLCSELLNTNILEQAYQIAFIFPLASVCMADILSSFTDMSPKHPFYAQIVVDN